MSPACRRFERLLPLFAGDDLSPDEAAGVRGHVGGCTRCRSAVADLREARAWLRRGAAPALGAAAYADLRRAVRLRVEARRQAPYLLALLARTWAFRGRERTPALALAVTALLAIGSVGALVREAPRSAPGGASAIASSLQTARPPALAAAAAPAAGLLAQAYPASDEEAAEPDIELAPADTLRIEMQTSDPDVRIIWFSPRAPRSGARRN